MVEVICEGCGKKNVVESLSSSPECFSCGSGEVKILGGAVPSAGGVMLILYECGGFGCGKLFRASAHEARYCPYCGCSFHKNHLHEWLRLKNECPHCSSRQGDYAP